MIWPDLTMEENNSPYHIFHDHSSQNTTNLRQVCYSDSEDEACIPKTYQYYRNCSALWTETTFRSSYGPWRLRHQLGCESCSSLQLVVHMTMIGMLLIWLQGRVCTKKAQEKSCNPIGTSLHTSSVDTYPWISLQLLIIVFHTYFEHCNRHRQGA